MGATGTRVPSYRHHKPSDRAVVTLNGHDHYLGAYGSPASRRAYEELTARWLAGGRRPLGARPHPDAPAVAEVLLAYWSWAEKYYARGGLPSKQLTILKPVVARLTALFGTEPAGEFGPKKLQAYRDSLVAGGMTRTGVNRRVRLAVRAFRWAAAEELVPGSVAHALAAVEPLKRGRTAAPETEPVGPAPEADVEKTLKELRRPEYHALVRLQLLTGMRPGEAVVMRPCDLDTSGPVWVYAPPAHKTAHLGRDRRVYLGPQAREILRPWLDRGGPADRYLFRPYRPGPHPHLPEATYCKVIEAACVRAGVPRWRPNQLRHAAATRFRRECGLEAARVILGHATVATTQIYAERDMAGAVAVVARFG